LHRRKPELFRFVVQPDEDGIPLAQLLRGRFGMSRGMIRRLKREPSVFSNGEAIPLRHRVRAGETITLLLPAAPESGVLAEPGPLDIVFEDRHLLVVDKPAGVLVHPAGYEQTGTLANAVAHRLASQGYPGGAGAVTRLDRDTSGLVLFAKHPHAHHRMSRALAEGAVSRRYIAVAHGEMRRDEGTVDAPIRRESPTSSLRLVGPGGQRAVTHFRVLARAHPSPLFPRGASLVELALETGRTHQIRVHLAHLGHPLVGDRLYGGGPESVPGAPPLPRHALHAYRLEFPHPISGERLCFSSAPPADMQPLVEAFDGGAEALRDRL